MTSVYLPITEYGSREQKQNDRIDELNRKFVDQVTSAGVRARNINNTLDQLRTENLEQGKKIAMHTLWLWLVGATAVGGAATSTILCVLLYGRTEP
jgi:hypothetical protein